MFKMIGELDDMSKLRAALKLIGDSKGEWAGIPMPIDGADLVVEPSYPWAHTYKKKEERDESKDYRVRNQFWSSRYRADFVIVETFDKGKIRIKAYPLPGSANRVDVELQTLYCSDAWGIEQEYRAIHLLASLIPHFKFRQYLLTGTFIDRSERSGVVYMFRKLKPTLALVPSDINDGGRWTYEDSGSTISMRVLCAMCMHPIAYYQGSWAGAMCPTDDIIAHLMMMRGDEKMFWRRCNQHPPHHPLAGI